MGLRFNRQANDWAVALFVWAFNEAKDGDSTVNRRAYCSGVGRAVLELDHLRHRFNGEARAMVLLGPTDSDGGVPGSYLEGYEDGRALLRQVWTRQEIPGSSFGELLPAP